MTLTQLATALRTAHLQAIADDLEVVVECGPGDYRPIAEYIQYTQIGDTVKAVLKAASWSTPSKKSHVFRYVRYVRRRGSDGERYAIELVTRRTSTPVYRSSTCDSLEQAHGLASAWLSKHPTYEDTTTSCPGYKP